MNARSVSWLLPSASKRFQGEVYTGVHLTVSVYCKHDICASAQALKWDTRRSGVHSIRARDRGTPLISKNAVPEIKCESKDKMRKHQKVSGYGSIKHYYSRVVKLAIGEHRDWFVLFEGLITRSRTN